MKCLNGFGTTKTFFENKGKVEWKSGKSLIQCKLDSTSIRQAFGLFSALSTKSQTFPNRSNIRSTRLTNEKPVKSRNRLNGPLAADGQDGSGLKLENVPPSFPSCTVLC